MGLEKETIAIVAITNNGKDISLKIQKYLPQTIIYLPHKLGKNTQNIILFKESLKELCQKLFIEYERIVFCMALGIVVRVIGHYLKDKFHDPAIVVVDDCARFAISTLSGHEGRANNLAYLIAGIIGAQPVITTASQTNKKFIIGLGCRDKIKKKEIIDAIKEALKLKSLDLDDVREVATIDLKANDKEIISACEELNIPIRIIPIQQIKNLTNIRYNTSELVKNKIGIGGVCEPCALLSGKNAKLILPKTILDRVTIAIAEENCM